MFISFEGGEGSGKSTQVKLLAEHLKKQGKEVVITREPGGTPTAEKIRDMLLADATLSPLQQCILNFAARIDHVEKLIKPALKRGAVVISDRFFDSTYAYQGYAQGLPKSQIKAIHKAAIGAFKPDVTFILDLDPKKGKARTNARGAQNHYDKAKLNFHTKIRAAFLDIAAKNKRRCKVIAAANAKEKVAKDILGYLTKASTPRT
jgi:dTMP kinase